MSDEKRTEIVSYETVVLESGQEIRVHPRAKCVGPYCAIHNPMPGPWENWPRLWRSDREIMERMCPCEIGHPVAEMHQWAISTGKTWKLTHGCCVEHQCGPLDGGQPEGVEQ